MQRTPVGLFLPGSSSQRCLCAAGQILCRSSPSGYGGGGSGSGDVLVASECDACGGDISGGGRLAPPAPSLAAPAAWHGLLRRRSGRLAAGILAPGMRGGNPAAALAPGRRAAAGAAGPRGRRGCVGAWAAVDALRIRWRPRRAARARAGVTGRGRGACAAAAGGPRRSGARSNPSTPFLLPSFHQNRTDACRVVLAAASLRRGAKSRVASRGTNSRVAS